MLRIKLVFILVVKQALFIIKKVKLNVYIAVFIKNLVWLMCKIKLAFILDVKLYPLITRKEKLKGYIVEFIKNLIWLTLDKKNVVVEQ
jgi:hypothetical protein